MNRFSRGFEFGGGYNHNFPVPNGGGSGIVSNGLNIYAFVNMGLHFLTVIAVLLLIFYIIRRLAKYPFRFSRCTDKALEILGERYARGEIDREEYLQKRDDLKRG